MIIRNRGGDALGLISSLFFVFSLLQYLHVYQLMQYEQRRNAEIVINGFDIFLSLLPLIIPGIIFLILFLLYPKRPKKISKIGIVFWVLIFLYYCSGLFSSEKPIPPKILINYVLLGGAGVLFIYSSYLQAIRLENSKQS